MSSSNPASNHIDLESAKDSRLSKVSVYTGRAELIRVFNVDVKQGLNHLNIKRLPSCLDPDSLRVEGKGFTTIHDVSLSDMDDISSPPPPGPLASLYEERDQLVNAVSRNKKAASSLDAYIGSFSVEHLVSSKLTEVITDYDAAAEKLEGKISALEKQLKALSEKIKSEEKTLGNAPADQWQRLQKQASVSVFSNEVASAELTLTYAVHLADWNAGYDIRVSTTDPKAPVTVVYKAGVVQTTGESWDNVPLTLETAAPSYGVSLPSLGPWNISVIDQVQPKVYTETISMMEPMPMAAPPSEEAVPYTMAAPAMASVVSKGDVNATYQVPGTVNIPSDGSVHNFTIAELELEAELSWLAIPKVDTAVHLKARINNASDFTLLPGSANIYVDGSFVSRSNVSSVSPQESFDCPLGIDPSIRATYPPCVKKAGQSGFYGRNTNTVYTQKISLQNTKSTPITVKVVDQIQESQDERINVKLTSPALSSDKSSVIALERGVKARWELDEEQGVQGSKTGNVSWTCEVPAQGSKALSLQWEISFPTDLKKNVYGL